MQDKDFDQLFKQRFDDLEVEPSSSSWEKISKELDGASKKRKTLPPYWMAAASVVLLASAIWWLDNPVDVIKLQGKSQGQVAVIKEQVENDTRVDNEAADELYQNEVIAPIARKKRFMAAGKTDKENTKTRELPVSEKEAMPLESQVLLAKQEVKVQVDDYEPAIKVSENAVVLAQVNDDIDENSTGSEDPKPRIKSIGGLVNFVIAQVDKRDDKIIEFRDGQEGSQVSGINLGPLKFKSRK